MNATRRFLAATLPLLLAGSLAAQARGRISVAGDFVKDPDGTLLGRLAAGAPVTLGKLQSGWQEVTLDGWIAASALRDDAREGFDVSVAPAEGAVIRAAAGTGATLGTARTGALFNVVAKQAQWVHVRRTAWVSAAALKPPAPAKADTAAKVPAAAGGGAAATTTLMGGSALAAGPGGTALGSLEAPISVQVLEHRSGWAHIQLDAWVRDGALGDAPPPGSITAADIRSQPDRYVGQTVEWTLQVIAVETADELRPELPQGQPYVLARGPLPETGFVYLVITTADKAAFTGLQPLAKIRVRATIRAGKTRYLPVPVLNFVRRLN